MSGVSSIDGRYWSPLGARHAQYKQLESGQLVAFDHQVWQLVEVSEKPADTERPVRVRLRPARLANHPDPVKAASEDQHYAAASWMSWNVFPDAEHYPVCACCAEPMPCRAEVGRKMAQAAVKDMGRYETAGVCPACTEVVSARQKALTFPDNLMIIAGPPVTFHLRGRCRGDAMTYEKRWVAADPGRRRTTLSCAGHLTNHNDGTYDCTQFDECPSPVARHQSMSTCVCPPCHAVPWTWGRGCCPSPAARLSCAAGDPRAER